MKASEFRIWNIVKCPAHNSDYSEITELTQDSFSCRSFRNGDVLTEGSYDLSLIEQIPLTEEWLINFRLKRKDEDHFYLKEDDHQILVDINTFDVVLDFREEGYYVTVKHDLKYVHKLQNFYFELNETELELRQ